MPDRATVRYEAVMERSAALLWHDGSQLTYLGPALMGIWGRKRQDAGLARI